MTRLRKAALVLALLAALALAVSGPGTRFGLLPWQAGLALFAGAGLLGVAAAVAAAITRRFALLALGAAAAAMPVAGLVQALSVPRINDVRGEFLLPGTADSAFPKALIAAEGMGWKIEKSDPRERRIEAVASTFWFGFKDDVEVRVVPAATGARIEVRSKSRVGRGDAGANASRIKAYFERLK